MKYLYISLFTVFLITSAFLIIKNSDCHMRDEWHISPEEMRVSCADLKGIDNWQIGKTTLSDIKKLKKDELFDQFDSEYKFYQLIDSLDYDTPYDDEFLKYDEIMEGYNIKQLKKVGARRYYDFNYRTGHLAYFYNDKLFYFKEIEMGNTMNLLKKIIMKYGNGNGKRIGDYATFSYENGPITMFVEKDERLHSYTTITLCDTLIVNKVKLKLEKVPSHFEDDSSSVLDTVYNEPNSKSYSSSSYHSLIDGTPQKEFQGSLEQAQQLEQMDEMGW